MGYNTEFAGNLKIESDITPDLLALISCISKEHTGDHPEWISGYLTSGNYLSKVKHPSSYNGYIELELNRKKDGLVWTGSEKTYDMDQQINCLIFIVSMKFPGFKLSGHFEAQGEETSDKYIIRMVDNKAVIKQVVSLHMEID